jgi:hypothetical protein
MSTNVYKRFDPRVMEREERIGINRGLPTMIKGQSPYNGKLSDFSFYIDSQISVHRKFKK